MRWEMMFSLDTWTVDCLTFKETSYYGVITRKEFDANEAFWAFTRRQLQEHNILTERK